MEQKVELKLYIIEKSAAYSEIVSKLYILLDSEFDSHYKLDIIDILKNPEMTVEDGIFASPTLVRVKPLPSKRIVGSILAKNPINELDLKEVD